MACPYFVPVDPWSEATGEPWPGPRRVPLGEPYRGRCSRTQSEIDPHEQATLCNFGYARGRCSHFPESEPAAPDAVRFSISIATADDRVELIWIAELEHAPTSYGRSEFSRGSFDPDLPPEYLPLALGFVRTFLKGKSPQGILR